MNNNDDRIEQFRAEVDGLKLKGSSSDGERRMLILGAALVLAGIALAVLGALTVSASGGSPADQRANMAQGSFLGIALLIVGVGLYIRYSLARYLRFWLIRLTYEGRANTDRIVDAIERAGGLPSTLETPLFPGDAYEIPLDPDVAGGSDASATRLDDQTPASPEAPTGPEAHTGQEAPAGAEVHGANAEVHGGDGTEAGPGQNRTTPPLTSPSPVLPQAGAPVPPPVQG